MYDERVIFEGVGDFDWSITSTMSLTPLRKSFFGFLVTWWGWLCALDLFGI